MTIQPSERGEKRRKKKEGTCFVAPIFAEKKRGSQTFLRGDRNRKKKKKRPLFLPQPEKERGIFKHWREKGRKSISFKRGKKEVFLVNHSRGEGEGGKRCALLFPRAVKRGGGGFNLLIGKLRGGRKRKRGAD